MNGNWEFGWEAVAVVVGIISLVLFIVVERDRLRSSLPDAYILGLITAVVIAIAVGFAVGYTIVESIYLRMIALILATLSGSFYGAAFTDEDAHKPWVVIILVVQLLAVIVGFWAGYSSSPI